MPWRGISTVPERIVAADGTMLMDREALTEAIKRYDEGMRI